MNKKTKKSTKKTKKPNTASKTFVSFAFNIFAGDGRLIGEVIGNGKTEESAHNDAQRQIDKFFKEIWIEAR